MENAVVARYIERGAVRQNRGTHAVGNLEGRDDVSRRRVDDTHRAGIIGDDAVAAGERHAGPVVTDGVLVGLVPHDLAVGQADTQQVAAVTVRPISVCRPIVGVAVTHRDGREGLLAALGSIRQRIGHPLGGKRVDRKSLEAAGT